VTRAALAPALALLAVSACGGGGSNGSNASGQGDYSWSVTQTNTAGQMVSCVNYTHQKVTAAQAMTMVQGGTVSADPCPLTTAVVGVCSGVDAGGNDSQQVFYNYDGKTGATLTAAVANLMLSCGATNGAWTTSYDGAFVMTTGAGGGGSVSASDFVAVWQGVSGTYTDVCGSMTTTPSFTPFTLEFRSDGSGGLVVIDSSSCTYPFTVSGSVATMTGTPQTCSDAGNIITWTQDVFTLSADRQSMDEVGTVTNTTASTSCTQSDAIHYTRTQGGSTGTTTGCALCDKAGACCAAYSGSSAGCAIYSAAMCSAQPAAAQATYVADICQTLLNQQESSGLSACQ
jgi:hypothetical protein